jgi:hypothetical protein
MVELLAMTTVIAVTYLFVQILGPRPQNVLLSQAERARWSGQLAGKTGAWLYICNVAATLTSLATVYVFFIGTSQLFGAYIFVCVISIFLGSYVTTTVTRKLVLNKSFSARLESPDASAAVIASLFWSPQSTREAYAIKYITELAIFCILWLEFATLAHLFVALFGIESAYLKYSIMFIAVFFTFDFTIRNGLRGFLFSDLLLFPVIGVGVFFLVGGTLYVLGS